MQLLFILLGLIHMHQQVRLLLEQPLEHSLDITWYTKCQVLSFQVQLHFILHGFYRMLVMQLDGNLKEFQLQHQNQLHMSMCTLQLQLIDVEDIVTENIIPVMCLDGNDMMQELVGRHDILSFQHICLRVLIKVQILMVYICILLEH